MPEPGDADHYCFERGDTKTGGMAGRTDGFGDVWRRGCFGWEYMAQPEVQQRLRAVWQAPDTYKPRRSNRDITEEAARSFAETAERLRAGAQIGSTWTKPSRAMARGRMAGVHRLRATA